MDTTRRATVASARYGDRMSDVRSTEHRITMADVRNLMSGEGGVDLRIVTENGKQVAMRVVGVSPSTTAARIGARNDDTIETINDVPLTTIPAAYAAGDAAVRSGRITIRGKRAGEPYITVLVIDAAAGA